MNKKLKIAKILRIFNLVLLLTSGIILCFIPSIIALGSVIVMGVLFIGSCLEVFDLNILEGLKKE